MNEVKPFASLSSGLLARKGQAKPAMRPQGFGTFGAQSTGFDDLGWNDMGHDRAPPPQVGLSPMEADVIPFNGNFEADAVAAVEPVVFQQREAIQRSYDPAPVEAAEAATPILATKRRAVSAPVMVTPPAPAPEMAAASVATPVTPVVRTAPGRKARAAFTLRLDQDRHLKLRLASAVAHRSAQALVIEALDAFLAKNPGIPLPATAN